ncbi:MAG: hypothetical protein M1816_006795 [Peltula sp. TS41687]|nr:MAG: hypothetical protein M1816_006795 [Peltula sp. TS41687]
MAPTLERLPNEIVQHILFFLPAESAVAVLKTSRCLNRVANEPTLWRHYCLRDFKLWDESHHIRQRLTAPISITRWQQLYRQRVLTDRKTTSTLNSILASQPSRIAKFDAIVNQGYDTKDTILRHLRVGDEAEDVLARRYFSKALLGHLHRATAIKEWIKAQHGCSTLERALVAFDMFVLHHPAVNFDSVSHPELSSVYIHAYIISVQLAMRLDDWTDVFRKQMGTENRTTREKTLALAKLVRAHSLTGLDSGLHYRDLENNLISLALASPKHPSLPLISVALFCALGERLGLDARPCGFPEHVHAMVYPPEGFTLDGDPASDQNEAKPMYLDPFSSHEEVAVEALRERLSELRLPPNSTHDDFLGSASVKDMVMRTARNIWQSVRESKRRFGRPMGDVEFLSSSYSLDHESAFYGAMFALLVLGYIDQVELIRTGVQPTQIALYINHILETHFPEDVTLVENHIIPLFEGLWSDGRELIEATRIAREADEAPKRIRSRGDHLPRKVKYKIGQIFKHRRYAYQAVIIGWDANCEAGEAWIQMMNVDTLPQGRNQTFYHILDNVRTTRYVAEENIEIVTLRDPPPWILPWAGRYFKRWNGETGTFVSNIRDEYPDD